jgi:hypothetical protein
MIFCEVRRIDAIALLKQFCEIKDNNLYVPFLRFEDGAEVSRVTGYRPQVFSKIQIWHLHT